MDQSVESPAHDRSATMARPGFARSTRQGRPPPMSRIQRSIAATSWTAVDCGSRAGWNRPGRMISGETSETAARPPRTIRRARALDWGSATTAPEGTECPGSASMAPSGSTEERAHALQPFHAIAEDLERGHHRHGQERPRNPPDVPPEQEPHEEDGRVQGELAAHHEGSDDIPLERVEHEEDHGD